MKSKLGFTLVEMLLVVALIGTIAAIAVPTLWGARRHARYVGDASANYNVMRMQLETTKADQGLFPLAATYVWTAAGAVPAPNPLPAFRLQGNSALDYSLVVNDDRLRYTITVTNPREGNAVILVGDQNGITGP